LMDGWQPSTAVGLGREPSSCRKFTLANADFTPVSAV
jgi:hypothetical protein